MNLNANFIFDISVTHEGDNNSTYNDSTIDLDNPIFADYDPLPSHNSGGHPAIHRWTTKQTQRKEEDEQKEDQGTLLDAATELRDNETSASRVGALFSPRDRPRIVDMANKVDYPGVAFAHNYRDTGGNRGRALYGQEKTSRMIYHDSETIEEGVWEVRRTPCSVTCGEGGHCC